MYTRTKGKNTHDPNSVAKAYWTSMWRDDCNLRDVLKCLNQWKKNKLEAGLVHFATAAAVRNYRLGPFRGFLWPLGSESKRKILYVPPDRLYYESELFSRPRWSLLKSSKEATIAVKRQQTVSSSHHKLNHGPQLFPSLCCPHQLCWLLNLCPIKITLLGLFPSSPALAANFQTGKDENECNLIQPD